MGNIISTTNPSGNIYSGMSVNSTFNKNPLQKYEFEIQNKINNEWSMASDIYTIQEESPFGSQERLMKHSSVRVT